MAARFAHRQSRRHCLLDCLCFAVVTEEEIAKIKEDSIPKKTKQATKYGLKIFQGKILNFACFYLEKNWLSRNATQSRV